MKKQNNNIKLIIWVVIALIIGIIIGSIIVPAITGNAPKITTTPQKLPSAEALGVNMDFCCTHPLECECIYTDPLDPIRPEK